MQNWSPQILSINVYNHTDQQLAMLFFDYKVTYGGNVNSDH